MGISDTDFSSSNHQRVNTDQGQSSRRRYTRTGSLSHDILDNHAKGCSVSPSAINYRLPCIQTPDTNSPPGCMDPMSQPERRVSSSLCHAFIDALQLAEAMSQVNTKCASSLTSPSSCMQRLSYIENCVAYCEQYLYWFFGPEVPFLDSSCEAYEPCTFAGAKSVAVTNGYSFDAGLSASIPSKVLEAAFNVGASYTYSITETTSQTLTLTRPGNSAGSGNCGYWTFIPYYIQ